MKSELLIDNRTSLPLQDAFNFSNPLHSKTSSAAAQEMSFTSS